MKQKGNYISGDPVKVEDLAKGWSCIYVHPAIFYSRFDHYREVTTRTQGLYTDVDYGQMVKIMFQDPVDATMFKMTFKYL
jgi:hypothetical protein